MNIWIIVSSILVGWTVAGLCNWMADHLPHWQSEDADKSLPLPTTIAHYWTLWWYPWRNGICPHCAQPRSWRAPVLEVAMILFFLLVARGLADDGLRLIVAWIYTAFMLTVLVIDYEHHRILNLMLLPACVIVALLTFVLGTPQPLNALIGGAIGLALFLVLALIGRGALGMGDVKLAGLIGLMTGYPGVLSALLLSIFLAGGAAVVLMLSKKVGRKSYMAYGPYMALAGLLVAWRVLGL